MKKIIIIIGLILTAYACTPKVSQDQAMQNSIEKKDLLYDSRYDCSYATATDPQTLYNASDFCFEGRVKTIQSSQVDEVGTIKTPITIEVIHNVKGELSENINSYYMGGTVLVLDYKKYVKESVQSKMKVKDINDQTAKTKYIRELPNDYIELKENNKYLFFMNKDEIGYHINSNGYGVLEKMNNGKFKNLLNDSEISLSSISQ